jgi:hypothetical protein
MICCEREMVRCRRFDRTMKPTITYRVRVRGEPVWARVPLERRLDTYQDGWFCITCDRFVPQSYASSSSDGTPSVLASSASSATS